MPTWLVPTLKWGGIVLAIVSAIALIYVQMAAPAPGPETGEAVSEAPVTLYWILLVIGVLGAIAGFVIDRRQRPT
jgi:amino acid transporter